MKQIWIKYVCYHSRKPIPQHSLLPHPPFLLIINTYKTPNPLNWYPFFIFNSAQNLIHTPEVITTPTPVLSLTSLLVHMQPSILKQSLSPTPPLIIRFTVEWRHARRWGPNEPVSLTVSLMNGLKKQNVNPLTQICRLFFWFQYLASSFLSELSHIHRLVS